MPRSSNITTALLAWLKARWRSWARPVLPPEYVDLLLSAGRAVTIERADLAYMVRYIDAHYPAHTHYVRTRGEVSWIRRGSRPSLTAEVVEVLAARGAGATVQAPELAEALCETRVRVGRVLTALSAGGGPLARGERHRCRTYHVTPAIAAAAARRGVLVPVGVEAAAPAEATEAADFPVAA